MNTPETETIRGTKSSVIYFDEPLQKEDNQPEEVTPETSEPNFDQMKNMLEVATVKQQLETSLGEIRSGQDQLLVGMASPKDKDLFKHHLDAYDIKDLELKVKDKKFVQSLFTEEDGNPMIMNATFESDQREYEFKRDLILYFKASQDYEKKIDAAIASINDDYKEFETDMNRICNTLSDNLLGFIEELKDKSNKLEGDARVKAEQHILYLESAYTMQVFIDLLEKYPSIVSNTLSEFNNPVRIKDMIKKYENSCKKAKVDPILSNLRQAESMSFEERFLIRGTYLTPNGLFNYILIRYFAMNDIQALNGKLHSAVSIVLRMIYRNRMTDDTKKLLLTSIQTLLDRY